jgi:pimeloyl-ACP methyl ester carboxylesterase
MAAEDLPATAASIDTAFFVIEGAEDVVTPTSLAVDFFNRVKAPLKELILLPHQGHFAFLTDPNGFLAVLTGKVRPVAIARGA